MKAVGELENNLSRKLRFRLRIMIPYQAIQIGQNWSCIKDAFKYWIMESSPSLADGIHFIDGIKGIPFGFRVNKSSHRAPGLFFSRSAPEDDSLPERLRTQLERKAPKLMPYKQEGYTTILLVESEDIALMNEDLMLDGIRRAFAKCPPEGVDQLWYADTTIPEKLLFYDFTESIAG